MGGFDSGHEPVTLHVIEPVSVELTSDDGGVYVLRLIFVPQYLADSFGKMIAVPCKNFIDSSITFYDFGTPLFVALGKIQRLGDLLESVAEGAVTDIMQKCRQHDDLCPCRVETPLSALNDLNDLARYMIDADAVSESTVCSAGVDEIGKPNWRMRRSLPNSGVLSNSHAIRSVSS